MLTRRPLEDRYRWRGMVRVEHRSSVDGRLLHVARMPNLITAGGLDLLVSALGGTDAHIGYLAWGTDSTAPDPADVALYAEAGRKAVTAQQLAGAGVYETATYLAPADANVAIEELGWFAGADATAAPDSGVLLARVLYSYEKDNLESILVVRTDTLGAA